MMMIMMSEHLLISDSAPELVPIYNNLHNNKQAHKK